MEALVTMVEKHCGRFDLMENDAGISHANRPMLNVSKQAFDRTFQPNVKSLFLSTIHSVPVFRAAQPPAFLRRGCAILNRHLYP